MTIIEKVYEVPPGVPADKLLTALSVCIGLFIIVITLVEWGAASAAKAEALHANAEALNEFRRKCDLLLVQIADGVGNGASVESLRAEYERIKSRCGHNHDRVDDQLFVASHRAAPEFADQSGKPRMSWFVAKTAGLVSLANAVSYFALLWIVVLALGYIALRQL